ncbi:MULTISPECIES: low specificity L-threonine aldolase [unclassified Streptomyces]|uniref:threonine aldolase family protein n=1 Tax=unclassified Streptomyces TaxID=2593676 RepID=UPI002259A89D|nr:MULTISPECIES: beta-eliminating lyase-related protein [unclassified Streptomyces]MCX4989382.1 beta-eliminating lyase-related protein [Streptomyces sp. NBC_00568]MCX5005396.1 beta-eliminating lyase-related protein [Streptomyces sp. NBC_00638]
MSDTAAESGTEPAERAGEEAAPLSPEERFERRAAAWKAAERVLWRPSHQQTLRERLTWLSEAAESVCDLDGRVDMYGDGLVETLEERVAELLGMEAAAFFPTGTMAQQVALRCWAGRTGDATVALHPLNHPEVHERHAFSRVSGLRPVHVTDAPRLPTAEEVRDFPEPFGALLLELPLRDAGFVLPSWEELNEVVEAARERDAVVHFDGARLWECTPHFDRPLEEIAGLADSVYVSFYKSLGGFGGAAVAGPRTLVDEAKTWRHRYGGMIIQQFPTVLSALIGLERELPRLPEYVAHARVVAGALREGFTEAGVPWVRVHPEEPHTHQFQIWLPYEPDVLGDAGLRQTEETKTGLFAQGWARGGPGLAYTEITVAGPGLEWTADDVKAAVRAFVERLPGGTE